MTVKSVLIIGMLGLSSLAFARTKTYDIILNNPAKVGANELKPGDYKVKVDGSQVVFSREGQEWTAPVKVENGTRHFDATTVESSAEAGDMDRIKAIDLAGSNTKLELQ